MADSRVRARQNGDGEAFLFPSLARGAENRPQTHEAFVRWYQKRLHEAGYESAEFAGHSFRAGGATDLHTGKVPEVLGRLLGRWRCREAYFLYLREDPSLQAAHIRDAFEAAFEVTTEDSG
jgi:integrase